MKKYFQVLPRLSFCLVFAIVFVSGIAFAQVNHCAVKCSSVNLKFISCFQGSPQCYAAGGTAVFGGYPPCTPTIGLPACCCGPVLNEQGEDGFIDPNTPTQN